MTELVTSLFADIDSLSERDREDELSRIVRAWRDRAEMPAVRAALADWIGTEADTGVLRTRARETSTHYVWPLHLATNGFGVAINEFKDPVDISPGYATVLHDHRYSFFSVILSGGYRQIRSQVELRMASQASQVRDIGEDVVAEGDIVPIKNDEFHRLESIDRHTVTLVMKCRAVKDTSLSVDTGTLRVTRHLPVEARVRELIATLATADEPRR